MTNSRRQSNEEIESRLSQLEQALTTRPKIHATKSANQSVTQNTWIKLTFDGTEPAHTNQPGMLNTSLSRITPDKAGMWAFHAGTFGIGFDNRATIALVKNGLVIDAAHMRVGHSGGVSGDMGMQTHWEVEMNGTTDYMEVWVFHFSSGAVSYVGGVDTFFTGTYIGAM